MSAEGLARSAWADRVGQGLTVLSSLALGVMLVATALGVILRYVFNAPLLGHNEIVQLCLVALVMLAMAPAAQAEMHIRVDVLDNAIGRFGRFVGDLLARGLSIYVLGALAWRTWTQALDAMEFGDATNMLGIPLWPFYGLIVLGAVLYGLVLALQLVDRLRGGGDE